jgi:hypothetical protein
MRGRRPTRQAGRKHPVLSYVPSAPLVRPLNPPPNLRADAGESFTGTVSSPPTQDSHLSPPTQDSHLKNRYHYDKPVLSVR